MYLESRLLSAHIDCLECAHCWWLHQPCKYHLKMMLFLQCLYIRSVTDMNKIQRILVILTDDNSLYYWVMSKFAIKGLVVPLIFLSLFSNPNPGPNQGFIQSGGVRGWGENPLRPPQEILKLSVVIIVLSQVLKNNLVPDYNLNLSGGGSMHPDPLSRHTQLCMWACLRMLLSSCYDLVFPSQLKILYELC